jgi:sulfite oxidase
MVLNPFFMPQVLALALGLVIPFTPLQASDLLIQHNSKPIQAEGTLDALSFWETPIEGFFIRSHHPVPTVDASSWILKIDGLVDHELRLTLSELKAMPQKSLHAVLQCSGNRRGQQTPTVPGVQWQKGAIGNAQWEGVSLADLLKRAGIQKKGRYLRLEGADNAALPSVPKFIRSIPLEKLSQIPAVLALEMNRTPLPVLHGGPMRLVLPGWYGENWIKWIDHISVTENEDPGFYMHKGYRMPRKAVTPLSKWDSATGIPIEELLVQSILTSPKEGAITPPGKMRVHGKAFSGAGSVARVEISMNGGEHWLPAQLEPPHSDGGWQEFSAEVQTSKIGSVTLLSRATDIQGNQQPLTSQWNPGGYLKNEVDRVTVLVSNHFQTQGAEILKQRCTTCHALELVTSQRISPSQWEATLKKMETFGVKLLAQDREALLNYLTHFSPADSRSQPTPIRYTAINPSFWRAELLKGDIKKGEALFKTNCTLCHGQKGEGQTGPRLRGKQIATADFWSTVKWGRDLMPSFAAQLKDQELADIRSYLETAP